MTIHPILFSGPMIRATLEGRKWQTRRVVDVPPRDVVHGDGAYVDSYCSEKKTKANPRGMSEIWCWWTRDNRVGAGFKVKFVPGDLLWVRETLRYDWTAKAWQYDADKTSLEATRNSTLEAPTPDRWPLGFCPSIHMPRWASRLTLKVAAVKVERVQDISEADAIAEGVARIPASEGYWTSYPEGTSAAGWLSPIDSFRTLWDSINGQKPNRAWADNPWVAAITFETIRKNVMEIANAD